MTTRTVSAAGVRLTVDSDRHRRFWSHVDADSWERTVLEAIAQLAADASVYVDVGAWIGPTALVAAASASKVVAYEPDPVAREELQQNLELNPELAEQITLRDVALATRDGELALSSTSLGDGMTSAVRRQGETLTARAVAADRELRAAGVDADAVVKIDVEGGEYELLRALRGFLRERPATLIVSFHSYPMLERRGRVLGRLASALAKRTVVPLFLLYRRCYWSVPPEAWRKMGLAEKLIFFASLREATIVFSRRPLELR